MAYYKPAEVSRMLTKYGFKRGTKTSNTLSYGFGIKDAGDGWLEVSYSDDGFKSDNISTVRDRNKAWESLMSFYLVERKGFEGSGFLPLFRKEKK